jgi:hypothetical protein
MDKERLEELKKLCEGATPGPWQIDGNESGTYFECGGITADGEKLQVAWPARDYEFIFGDKHDAAFIGESRTALPELIAEVEFLTKVAEQMRELGSIKMEESPRHIKWLTTGINIQTQYVYPELAQYLKRGKE